MGLFCRSSRNRPANFRPAVSSIRITLLAYVGTAAASQKVASRTVYTCFSDRDIFTDLDYFVLATISKELIYQLHLVQQEQSMFLVLFKLKHYLKLACFFLNKNKLNYLQLK